jgi:hypothetical protein
MEREAHNLRLLHAPYKEFVRGTRKPGRCLASPTHDMLESLHGRKLVSFQKEQPR